MRIHGLCLVKDEADVIAECLTAAAAWCDHIYVFDNGSTDGTWEIVNDLARSLPAVIAWKRDSVTFNDGLRAQIFNRFREDAHAGDWWCRLDADEFYVDDPRVFLTGVDPHDSVVWCASFSYYFTDRDAELYDREPDRYADDVPVATKIRYYINHWSEPRFFRHSARISWDYGGGFPSWVHSEPVCPDRIRVKHFPYRSPQQIDARLATRNAAMTEGEFSHEAIQDWGAAVGAIRTTRGLMERTGAEFAARSWRDRIVPAASLDYDRHDGRLQMNDDLMPPLPEPWGRARRAKAWLRLAAGRARRTGEATPSTPA